MEAHEKSANTAAVASRPLAELLDCPPETGNLLTRAAESFTCDAGQSVFAQDEPARGLFLVVSGEFLRKAERLNTRLTLGFARQGDLVELAAALGESRHTYTLTALTPGSLLLLPRDALRQAFDDFPPLRMRLLEELAREVSRAYQTCTSSRKILTRHRAGDEATA